MPFKSCFLTDVRERIVWGFFCGLESVLFLLQSGLGNLQSYEQSFPLKDSLYSCRLCAKLSNVVSAYCLMIYKCCWQLWLSGLWISSPGQYCYRTVLMVLLSVLLKKLQQNLILGMVLQRDCWGITSWWISRVVTMLCTFLSAFKVQVVLPSPKNPRLRELGTSEKMTKLLNAPLWCRCNLRYGWGGNLMQELLINRATV